jgi:hypothetical protein
MYLPKFKYKGDLTTPGREFRLLDSGEDYVGLYFETYNGKYYTESRPRKSSRELQKYNIFVANSTPNDRFESIPFPPIVEDYDVIRQDVHTFQLKSTYPVRTYYPKVSESDYEKRFLMRYYVRDKNTGTIQEVSSVVYENLQGKTTKYYYPKYDILKLRWSLLFFSENSKTISLGEGMLPGLRDYIKNPSEFIR